MPADHDGALHLVGLRGLLVEARPGDVVSAALVAERLGPQLVSPVRRIGSEQQHERSGDLATQLLVARILRRGIEVIGRRVGELHDRRRAPC